MSDQTGEIRNLTTLVEISQALSGTLNLKAALHRVLEILERHHGMIRSAVTLLREETGELYIEAANGITTDGHAARYRLGEGITGRVVESGKHIIVPQIGKEPLFQNRPAARGDMSKQELSFICVPVILNRKPLGALGVDLKFKKDRDYEQTVRFLRVVASMIAHALKLHRMVESERQRLLDENVHLRQELKERYDFSNIIGNSGAMRQVYEQVAQVARTNTTVLIRGESGTGKELIAHAIHYNSARAKKPFIKVSCAALPHDLIESELFGYEKGAFTGATRTKIGYFEQAHCGTLFLDEIGEMNEELQVKLLRLLENGEYRRLGESAVRQADVRIISATNRDLKKEVDAGSFRRDLFYRISPIRLTIPPLRLRARDIQLLVRHFLRDCAAMNGIADRYIEIDVKAMEALELYDWPGNVRELFNEILRVVSLIGKGDLVKFTMLSDSIKDYLKSKNRGEGLLDRSVEQFERRLILNALEKHDWNRMRTADAIGLPRTTLIAKTKRLNVAPK
jgi:Nif-specific regulatory protein